MITSTEFSTIPIPLQLFIVIITLQVLCWLSVVFAYLVLLPPFLTMKPQFFFGNHPSPTADLGDVNQSAMSSPGQVVDISDPDSSHHTYSLEHLGPKQWPKEDMEGGMLSESST